jgi:formate hydrogenlyase subunit 3/multisubunit Na+/H+ antiporter MnhD subunit
MPGSANFIGEFYILNALFSAKIVFAFFAAAGVVMAGYYGLRLFQRTMHGRKEGVRSREISLRDAAVLVPLVACIVGLAFYPQLILHRTENSTGGAVAAACLKGFSKDINPESRRSLFGGIEWNCPGFDPDAFASSPAPAAGESALAQSEPAKSSAR